MLHKDRIKQVNVIFMLHFAGGHPVPTHPVFDMTAAYYKYVNICIDVRHFVSLLTLKNKNFF